MPADNVTDLSDADVRRSTDRALLERTARESHNAWLIATQSRADIRDMKATQEDMRTAQSNHSELLGQVMASNRKIERRLGIVETTTSRASNAEKFLDAEIQDRELDRVIRKERWELVKDFGQRTIKWLFVGGGGAALYALGRYLLG